jgi:hypothetical protein
VSSSSRGLHLLLVVRQVAVGCRLFEEEEHIQSSRRLHLPLVVRYVAVGPRDLKRIPFQECCRLFVLPATHLVCAGARALKKRTFAGHRRLYVVLADFWINCPNRLIMIYLIRRLISGTTEVDNDLQGCKK